MSAAAKRKGGANRLPVSISKPQSSTMPTGALDVGEQRKPWKTSIGKRDFLGRSKQERLESLERSIEDLVGGKAIPFDEGLAKFE